VQIPSRQQILVLSFTCFKSSGIQDILKFEILMTPGLVINGMVKAAGRVPTTDEAKQLLIENRESSRRRSAEVDR
jgi:hypothetical protein